MLYVAARQARRAGADTAGRPRTPRAPRGRARRRRADAAPDSPPRSGSASTPEARAHGESTSSPTTARKGSSSTRSSCPASTTRSFPRSSRAPRTSSPRSGGSSTSGSRGRGDRSRSPGRERRARSWPSSGSTFACPPRRLEREPAPPGKPVEASDPVLFGALAAWRKARAKAEEIPAFIVFHNSVLAAIADARPGSLPSSPRSPGSARRSSSATATRSLEVLAAAP